LSSHSILRQAVLSALYGAGALSALPVAAQTQAPSGDVTVVNVVGSRRATSSLTDSVAPIDVIPLSKAAEQGAQFDLAQTLTFISPSFNSTRQTGADGAELRPRCAASVPTRPWCWSTASAATPLRWSIFSAPATAAPPAPT
jgi:iron complex outermembrane receptor protein